MTLLEALLATVILALVAVACLESTHGAATLQRRAAALTDALSRAETALESADVFTADAFTPDVAAARVERRPYSALRSGRVQRIDVEVRDEDGRMVRLSRLVDGGSGDFVRANGRRP